MSVPEAVLMAVLAAVVGLAVGGLLIPYVNARQAQRREADSGLTMSQVLDLIVLASESGIAVVDEYRDVVLVNPRAEELGLVRDRLLDERAWSAVEKVLATGEDVDFDLTAKNPMPGRSRIAVRGVARALSREESNFVVLFGDDDSEQARMEATRRDFVANVSHELKTPVGAMSLLAEALLESADDPDSVRHFGQRLLAESRRMGKMVTELIALSRLQGAEKLPELEAVDVDTVVNAAIERSRTAAEAAGITVSTDANSGLEILGDDTLLVTALSNLVENAINYSPKGSHVSVSRSLRGGYVNIAVTDRGIGIAKEDQERVFERFFRADKARSRATGGTGLGLAIVKHVAANHNGEIALWSKLGTGSTFTLRIPAVESEDQVSTVPVEKKSPAAIQAGKKETGARPVARARPNGVEATR
ncbi:cell wall metabolism sensor histidine kinase WalK [Nocardia sp. BMG111209]|uniref:sensor histidine kinase n=1 Tax=Nocardia sp. BMG111209 TaxID=1160137 RepID=UPI00035EB524|nr:ATP-binding protein [Nocardia sp. BMG111209]